MKRRSMRRQNRTIQAASAIDVLEDRQLLSAVSASIDGSDNNVDQPEWGSTDEELLRLTSPEYGDGVSTPAGADRPSARQISNEISAQSDSVLNSRNLTDFAWIWGQFLDHDIDLAKEGSTELFSIPVPAGDPYFDPMAEGDKTIPLIRAYFDPDTGTDVPREQINEITSFIDASNVYGSDATRAAFLRADGGKLKVSDGDYLPYNDGTQPNAGQGGDTAFVAGDVRANENVALTSMHTIFVREHNRLVDELAADHPDWSDDQLYNQAKAIVEA
ncbi:MAG: peroxidase family protein, partial [Planctomycetaceae bacterium]|nr:peroxidase family protein [Planctomycetaceae bacterium]